MEQFAEDRGSGVPPSAETDSADRLLHLSRLAMIGELSACFAHDVANPLMVIQEYLRQIEEQTSSDNPVRDHVLAATAASDRLGQLAARMLDFSRKHPGRIEICDASELVRDAFRFVEPYLLLRSVRLEVHTADEPTAISVDRNMLVQVLINLFQNAGDAMEGCSDRRLGVKIQNEPEEVRIEVSDTGRGIAEADISRVFEPFFTTKGHMGTGLGLYITRRIVVEELRGRIEVQSNLPDTVFTISLPHPSSEN
jgi:signal transduction histidine kinase